jgi:hypothetical protein
MFHYLLLTLALIGCQMQSAPYELIFKKFMFEDHVHKTFTSSNLNTKKKSKYFYLTIDPPIITTK